MLTNPTKNLMNWIWVSLVMAMTACCLVVAGSPDHATSATEGLPTRCRGRWTIPLPGGNVKAG